MAKQVKGNASIKPKLARKEYEKKLVGLQAELCHLQEWVKREGERIIIVFEAATVLERVAPLRQSQSA